MTKRVLVAGLMCAILVSAANAGPGQGIRSGPWVISPYADVSGTYDSNINKTGANQTDDFFLDSTLGLRAGYTTSLLNLSGLGFVSSRNYADNTDKDFGAGGELVRIIYGTRDQIMVEADQTFRRVEDIDRYASEAAVGGVSPDSVLDVSSRSRRDVNQAGISAGKDLTDKLELDAGYRFDNINYDAASLFDLRNHVGQLETAYKLTDKAAGFATVKAAVQENVTLSSDANYYAARLGMKSKGTDKVTFKGSAGFQQFELQDGDTKSALSYDVTTAWAASTKVVLQAGGRNGSALSSMYANNGAEYQSVWLAGKYQFNPSISTTMSGAYRVDDYINQVTDNGQAKDRKDNGFAGRFRADYQAPAKFLKLYTEASYEDMSSNIDAQDYNDTRVMLGAILSY